eukprot:3045366-Prymnesium_polylepis.1
MAGAEAGRAPERQIPHSSRSGSGSSGVGAGASCSFVSVGADGESGGVSMKAAEAEVAAEIAAREEAV